MTLTLKPRPVHPILAVVPARGGSKGLPGKNIRSLGGLPLIAHSLRCATMCPEIDRTIVSTDAEEIASVAREHGGDVPFIRPAELANDEAAMMAVVHHALETCEEVDDRRYEAVLLLDPTSPGRLPEDVARAVGILEADPRADTVVAVSQPDFNPLWHSVVEEDGYLAPLIPGSGRFARRQDVPPNFRINAMLYLIRRSYLLSLGPPWEWIESGRHKLLVLPDDRAVHIDTAEQFELTDLLIERGKVRLPWMDRT